jgi:hypothetical protein
MATCSMGTVLLGTVLPCTGLHTRDSTTGCLKKSAVLQMPAKLQQQQVGLNYEQM